MRTLIALVLIGGVLAVALPKLLTAALTDTEYAPGYNEPGFESISLGDTKADALRVLGSPLSTYASTPRISWLYCGEEHPGFSENQGIAGTFSLIEFTSAGEVLSSMGQTEQGRSWGLFSSSSTTTGDGGPLGASIGSPFVSPSRLKGLTQAQVQAKFGPPRHVRAYPAAETLVYSRSPSSTHYVLRRIGVDAADHVVEKAQYIYWD
ncbi:MAG: hypothetical protein ACJA2W_002752 [Planctomycetota bacterium]|jgi:hypothetical protein